MEVRLSAALAGSHEPSVSRGTGVPPVMVGGDVPGAGNKPPATPASPHERSTALKTAGPAADDTAEPEDDAAVATPPSLEDARMQNFDEAAESAFLAEAKERGEVVKPKAPDEAEEVNGNSKALPPLDELVNKIPADVRETLEDLFRARFVTVKRFPKKSLKQP